MKKNNRNLIFLDFWNIFINNLLFIIFQYYFFCIFINLCWFIVTPNYISNADVMVQVEQDSGKMIKF